MTGTESPGETPHVAITGAAGYIGTRLLGVLQEAHPDWQFTALDNFYRGDVENVGDVAIDHVDVRNRDRLEDALAGADAVAHLAAISGVDDCDEDPDQAFDVNVQATNDVAWFCRKTGAGLFFPVSMAVLGDPRSFPITVDHPRDPMNWYGRTKLVSERAIAEFAEGAFPAHLFLISNLYGGHEVDGRTISKGTVLNFFVDRALAGEPLTVYEPGTQSRNFLHVKDVARAKARSVERLVEASRDGETGATSFEVASDEDPSVMAVAELVADVAREHGHDPDVELVPNPRSGETLVESFEVDTTKVRDRLGWTPNHSIEETVRELLAE